EELWNSLAEPRRAFVSFPGWYTARLHHGFIEEVLWNENTPRGLRSQMIGQLCGLTISRSGWQSAPSRSNRLRVENSAEIHHANSSRMPRLDGSMMYLLVYG